MVGEKERTRTKIERKGTRENRYKRKNGQIETERDNPALWKDDRLMEEETKEIERQD